MDQLAREQCRVGGATPERAWEDRQTAFDGARRAWPDIELPLESFEAHLSAVGWQSGLGAHVSSLYLCAGCARQLPAAVSALEDAYLRPLRGPVRRIVREDYVVDEVMQDLRRRLLVGPNARIGTYRGTGPLHSWLRITAERIALDHRRGQVARRRSAQLLRRQLENEEQPAAASPERAAEGELCRRCEHLLHAVIQGLPPADKQLLQHHFVSGLGIDVLGAMYGIDRSTAARRIHRAVERVRLELCARVTRQFGTGSRAMGSDLLRQVRDRLELDLSVLQSAAGGAGPAREG